ncbi:MAG: hypothetical protein U0556_08220 [Dehalococcoidia bacterium]
MSRRSGCQPSRWTPSETYLVETKRWGLRDGPRTLRIGLIATISEPVLDRRSSADHHRGGPTLATSRDNVLTLATFHSDGRSASDATPTRLTSLPAGARPLGAMLADGARLEGVLPAAPACASPCSLDLTLYWRAVRPLDENLQVFLHIAGPDGRPVAQSDGIADEGRRPLRSWLADEIVADRHRIEATLLPGDYRLLAGLYDPATGQRLAGPDGDVIDLGPLRSGASMSARSSHLLRQSPHRSVFARSGRDAAMGQSPRMVSTAFGNLSPQPRRPRPSRLEVTTWIGVLG